MFRPLRRHVFIFILFSLLAVFVLTLGFVRQPGFTDAFYHMNAANRLVQGQGLTDAYLWTYIGLPESLPAPSHLYWMPMTSLLAAAGMFLWDAPGNYAAAQFFLTLMYWGAVLVAFWLGYYFGKTARHAWIAGLLMLFSGFFTRFWGATDTFAPYAFFGSLCMVFIGFGLRSVAKQRLILGLLAGFFAGFSHLTRADGLLLLFVAWAVIFWPWDWADNRTDVSFVSRSGWFVAVTLGYLIVMLPWFARNLEVIGTPLPIGGTQSIWYAEYDDLFSYPPDASPSTFLADGVGLLLQSRWDAFTVNLARFVAEQGLIVVAPLMLLGLWNRRHLHFLRGFWLYALGLHLAMTFVFTYPGVRGGLFHSAAALLPWWAALGVVGLDDAIDWIAKRRRTWRAPTAKWVFSSMLVVLAVFLSLSTALPGQVNASVPGYYTELQDRLPDDVRVMINDPAQLYYFTGLGGVVLPNEPPEAILEIARRYHIEYLFIEAVNDRGHSQAIPSALIFDLDNPPEFLDPLPFNRSDMRLYAIDLESLP